MKKPPMIMPASKRENLAAAQAMINQGGSVPSEMMVTTVVPVTTTAPDEDSIRSFTLRLYASMLKELQDIKEAQPKKKSRSIHQFILEAIEEKLKRENRKRTNGRHKN